MHTRPALFSALKAVQREFGIRKVRISQNVYRTKRSPLLSIQKALWNSALRFIYETRTADGFCDFLTFCQTARRCCARYRTLEAMVHPGSRESDEETRMVLQAWQSQVAEPIRLINYSQL
jgi:predicted glycoside hydrolase/deacetylase ChbG (UPF0249 family)